MDCNLKARVANSFEDIKRDMHRLITAMEAPEWDLNPSDYRSYEYFKLIMVDHISALVDELGTAAANRDWNYIRVQLREARYISTEVERISKIFDQK